MTNRLQIVLTVLCSAATVWSVAESADAQRPWSSWNPWSSSGEDSRNDDMTTTRVSDEPTSRFGLAAFPALPKPTLPTFRLPQWTAAPKNTSPQPSLWDKMSNGTKVFFHKTKQTLMPWANGKEGSKSASRTSISARRSGSAVAKPKPKDSNKGFFSSWFGQKEEKKVETVNDFLSLPHVPYE